MPEQIPQRAVADAEKHNPSPVSVKKFFSPRARHFVSSAH
jgi:hypothetical protein